jgi:predicted trehalose synthase
VQLGAPAHEAYLASLAADADVPSWPDAKATLQAYADTMATRASMADLVSERFGWRALAASSMS